MLVVGWWCSGTGVVVVIDESRDRWCWGCQVGDSMWVCKPVTAPPDHIGTGLGHDKKGDTFLATLKKGVQCDKEGSPLLVTLSYLQKWYVVSC